MEIGVIKVKQAKQESERLAEVLTLETGVKWDPDTTTVPQEDLACPGVTFQLKTRGVDVYTHGDGLWRWRWFERPVFFMPTKFTKCKDPFKSPVECAQDVVERLREELGEMHDDIASDLNFLGMS